MSKYRSNVEVFDLPCGGVSVFYYKTEIVRIEGEVLTLKHRGWDTSSTRKIMNKHLTRYNTGYRVVQRQYAWHVMTPSGEVVPFVVGMRFSLIRGLPTPQTAIDMADEGWPTEHDFV